MPTDQALPFPHVSAPRLPGTAQLPARPRQEPLDWQFQASAFDQFVMDRANGVAYRDPQGHQAFTAFLEGEHYGSARHELVTFGPLLLGKWLRGDDVAEMLRSLERYFLAEYGLFSNGPADTRCEMWYLMYANALAVHLIRRHSHVYPHWLELWQRSATALRSIAQKLDYDFHHQGFDFANHCAWTERDIFRQADALGGYAYLMLMTHRMFGRQEDLDEARSALRRYLAMATNPWYEVPDGAMAAMAAAYLAAQGEDFDVAKALSWLFDPDAALVLGEWGGEEVNGLARGWRFSERNSAYSMESLMVLPFVLPVARYAPEFALDIGRYALHVASNARLFYSPFMQGRESRPDLTPAVAYERLLESSGDSAPFATGDFQGHKSVYGGAYALWWGALVHPTEDPYVLQLDLAATDFLADAPEPAYLYYNPWPQPRTVRVPVVSGPSRLLELSTQRTLAPAAAGPTEVEIPASTAYVIAVQPSIDSSQR
jgi:hypothetical protein